MHERSHPEYATEQAASPVSAPVTEASRIERIKALVARFAQLQEALGASDTKFSARYRQFVGSPKAWSSLKAGRIEGYLNIERVLASLERMSSTIDGGAPVESYYDVLPFARVMSARLQLLRSASNDRLCLVALAITGVGKTVWARKMANKEPDEIVYSRARPTWRENTFAIAQGLARAVGAPLEPSPRAQTDSLVETLRGGQRRVLIVDEAHDGGVALLKMIKMLIDETGTRVVYLAYPTAWDKMISANEGAIAEARQLMGRAQKPIFDDYRHGTTAADVAAFVKAAAGLVVDVKIFADEILHVVRRHGNLRILEDAIDEAKEEAEEQNVTLTAGLIHQAVRRLAKAQEAADKTTKDKSDR